MSEETKHTKEPWALAVEEDGMWVHPEGRGTENVICDLVPRDADSFTEEDEANGHLIAAAPALLRAAQIALEQIQRTFQTVQLTPGLDDGLCTAKDDLREAINKARGKK